MAAAKQGSEAAAKRSRLGASLPFRLPSTRANDHRPLRGPAFSSRVGVSGPFPQFLSGRPRIRTANRLFSNQPEAARNGGDDTLRVPAGDGSLTTLARAALQVQSGAEEVVGLRKQVAALRSVCPGGVPGLNQTWPSRPRNGSRARPPPRMIRNCCPLNRAALVELGSGSESETSGVPLGLLMNKGDNDESLHA